MKKENEQLKFETLQEDNIVFKNKFWRYVNHRNKLLTKGFNSMTDLMEEGKSFSFTRESIIVMESRYKKQYVNKPKNV